MSRGSPAVVIPARLTVSQLGDAIGEDVEVVAAVLESRDEPSAPDDLVAGEVAISVATILGHNISIEPRDLALEHLYELETVGEWASPPQGKAGRLSTSVADQLDRLDSMIEEVSEHWSVSRMPLVDRNVLRIALFELLEDHDTPTGVIVSEAVRLAQTYSTERSGPFVNGVLATLARAHRS